MSQLYVDLLHKDDHGSSPRLCNVSNKQMKRDKKYKITNEYNSYISNSDAILCQIEKGRVRLELSEQLFFTIIST